MLWNNRFLQTINWIRQVLHLFTPHRQHSLTQQAILQGKVSKDMAGKIQSITINISPSHLDFHQTLLFCDHVTHWLKIVNVSLLKYVMLWDIQINRTNPRKIYASFLITIISLGAGYISEPVKTLRPNRIFQINLLQFIHSLIKQIIKSYRCIAVLNYCGLSAFVRKIIRL